MRYEPKDYQTETLTALTKYCESVRTFTASGATRPERDAFEQRTQRDYYKTPQFDGVPYVCLRVPTGGGKTILAARAVGPVGRELLRTDNPTCLWVVPTTTILEQTRKALQTDDHPYREALRDGLRGEPLVMTLEDALYTRRSVLTSTPVVILTTLQSYRIKDERTGEELESARRIYRDNGYLSEMFDNLPAETRGFLSKDERGNVDLSLANALKLRRPIVIMDEAHNARTPMSFESLARFGPSIVVELTATPHRDHNPLAGEFASNILHAVSALQLQKEGMIKLPVELENRGDWLEVLAAARQCRDELEVMADRHSDDTGAPRIRPIVLVQAQPTNRNHETHTPERVKAALIDRLGVPADYVRICTGQVDEIGDADLMADDCDIRYVITVDKLREGWDCPFAFVLASIGNAATPTAVEQVLGRVLRMPRATPTEVPALDRAYAFVLSNNILQTAHALRDRLVDTCGFDARSAADGLRVRATSQAQGLSFASIPLAAPLAANADLPAMLRAKVTFEPAPQGGTGGVLRLHGGITGGEAAALASATTTPQDKEAVEQYWIRERPLGTVARAPGAYAPPLRVPQLSVLDGQRRTVFEPEELETFAWNLDACATGLTEQDFSVEVQVGSRAEVTLTEAGGAEARAAGDVRLRQLELIGEGEDWSEVQLVRWLDTEIHRGGTLAGLTASQSQPWVRRVVTGLLTAPPAGRGATLPVLVRRRHTLADVLARRIAAHGRDQVRLAYQQLIRERPEAVETSPEVAMDVEESRYAPTEEYRGGYGFTKHAFQLKGAFANQAEADCAAKIDGHTNVRRWVRNLEHASQGGFSLPKSPGRFFPDFIVELNDGRIALVEYKGDRDPLPEEQHKKAVGELWESRGAGRCVFAWITNQDWQTLHSKLSSSE